MATLKAITDPVEIEDLTIESDYFVSSEVKTDIADQINNSDLPTTSGVRLAPELLKLCIDNNIDSIKGSFGEIKTVLRPGRYKFNPKRLKVYLLGNSDIDEKVIDEAIAYAKSKQSDSTLLWFEPAKGEEE